MLSFDPQTNDESVNPSTRPRAFEEDRTSHARNTVPAATTHNHYTYNTSYHFHVSADPKTIQDLQNTLRGGPGLTSPDGGFDPGSAIAFTTLSARGGAPPSLDMGPVVKRKRDHPKELLQDKRRRIAGTTIYDGAGRQYVSSTPPQHGELVCAREEWYPASRANPYMSADRFEIEAMCRRQGVLALPLQRVMPPPHRAALQDVEAAAGEPSYRLRPVYYQAQSGEVNPSGLWGEDVSNAQPPSSIGRTPGHDIVAIQPSPRVRDHDFRTPSRSRPLQHHSEQIYHFDDRPSSSRTMLPTPPLSAACIIQPPRLPPAMEQPSQVSGEDRILSSRQEKRLAPFPENIYATTMNNLDHYDSHPIRDPTSRSMNVSSTCTTFPKCHTTSDSSQRARPTVSSAVDSGEAGTSNCTSNRTNTA
ncbi:hypothetical protein C8Q79DRAFT_201166 [Trametes meyenii]|nr:hypothetical protein C8Q79DRAFT_201166 [Trametes meyenii]